MSFDESNQLYDNSFVDVMQYLMRKLESRYNSIIRYNKLLDTSDSPNSFFSLRRELKLLFNDLEDDFRQGIFAIKALTRQNKKIIDELKIKNEENKNLVDQLNGILSENKNLKVNIIKTKENNIPLKKTNSKKDINLRGEYENYEDEPEDDNYKKRNYSAKINNRNMERDEIEKFKKNNYEFEQLSNVKNIMDNMKKNKLKLKMAIEQHFTNNQNNDNN